MKQFKKIPEFKSEEEEANFWDTHDSTDYIDWRKAKITMFPNLKPSTCAIPLKFPEWLIERLKFLAIKSHTSYQALIRSFVAKEVQKQLKLLYRNN